MQKNALWAIAILAIAGLAGAWYFFDYTRPVAELGTIPAGEESSASTTPSSTPDFATIPKHEIPAGAKIIDDYFYTYNGVVYLNSVQSTSSIALQNVYAEDFRRLTDVITPTSPSMTLDCLSPGTYAFYADSKQLFFYQLWINSRFKHHEIRSVRGDSPEGLKLLNPLGFQTNLGTYAIDYTVGTSTCSYTFDRVGN